MRDSYKRFVKTWIRFANPWIVLYRSHESWLQKDSFCFVIDESGFVSYRGSQILHVFKRFVSWIRFVDWFSKDSTCFHESYESLRILSTIARNESESLRFGFANPDSWLRTLKIRIVDSFCGFVFERFVSWIRFVQTKISNYSIRFDS